MVEPVRGACGEKVTLSVRTTRSVRPARAMARLAMVGTLPNGSRVAGSELGGSDEEAGGRFFADRPLLAVQLHRDLARCGLGVTNLDLAAGDEPFLVEPVQQVAVVLRQADDRRVRAGFQIRQRRKVAVLGLLDIRIDGPAVRTALRMP